MAGYTLIAPRADGMNGGDFDGIQSVAVIGAGCAGLQMIRALTNQGLKVTSFDKAPKVGGLWQSNYHSFGIQAPRQLFEFPDFPWTAVERGVFATGEQTQTYIEDYAKHFGLLPHIRFNTEVVGVVERTDGRKGYGIRLQEKGRAETLEKFDFVVVATGMYSQKLNMPEWTKVPSPAFKGRVAHSTEYVDQAMAQGKKVLVIGGGKSAFDIVCSASEVASKPPTVLFREAHWSTPQYILGFIPFQYIFLSRMGQALVSWYKGPYPSGAPCYCCVCSWILFPIMWLAFRLVEFIFACQRGQFGIYAPKLDVVADFYGYAHVLDTTFVNKWNDKQVIGQLGEVDQLCAGGVKTKDGEVIEADLIICATGFSKTYDYLPRNVVQALAEEDDGLYLYRQFLPAAVRDLRIAFCGSEIATISNIMTYAIHAEYITRIITGRLTLPSKEVMQEEIETMKVWKRSWMPKRGCRASLVLLHQVHYHDQLLKDMGFGNYRKCCILGETFCPFEAGDYDGIISERQVKGP